MSGVFQGTASIYSPSGGGRGSVSLSCAINESENVADSERVIGGCLFAGQGAAVPIVFRFAGMMTGAGGNCEVRLYDMGPAAGPPDAPTLRSTLQITSVDAGILKIVEATLTPVVSPAAPNEIALVARIYEVRLFLTSPATTMLVEWCSVVTGS